MPSQSRGVRIISRQGNFLNSYAVFCAICLASALYILHELIPSAGLKMFLGTLFASGGALSLALNKKYYLGDRNWLSFEILFYAVFWILHFGVAALWLVEGAVPEMDSFTEHASALFENLPEATLLSACGGLAFVLAFLRFSRRRGAAPAEQASRTLYLATRKTRARQRGQQPPGGTRPEEKRWEYHILLYIQYGALLTSFATLVLLIVFAGPEFFESSYSGAPESYVARVADFFFTPFFATGLVVWLLCVQIRGLTILNVLPVLYYVPVMCFYLLIGERSAVALWGLCGLAMVGAVRYNFRFWQLVAAFIGASVLFMFVGEARKAEERTVAKFIETGVQAQRESEDPLALLGGMQHYSETALPAIVMVVEEVPEDTPHFKGYWSVKGLLSVIPFHGKLLPFLSEEQRYASSSEFITWLYFGESEVRTGMGTSIVAELYLDFGLIGVLAGMFLVGALGGLVYRRTRYAAVSYDALILYAIFAGSMVIGTRAPLMSILTREVLWPFLAYLLLKQTAKFAAGSRPLVKE